MIFTIIYQKCVRVCYLINLIFIKSQVVIKLLTGKLNMKIKLFVIIITLILLAVGLSGCTDDSSTKNNQEKILGTWYKEKTFGNNTYNIIYEFFSNSSFFSGVWDSNSSSYATYIRGSYELKNDNIFFNTTGENPSNSILKYSISEDGNSFTLFYEDEENFDVFKRQP